jgi:hypothetical protein
MQLLQKLMEYAKNTTTNLMEIWQHYSTHCIISRASSETLTIHYDNHEVSLQTSFSETDNTETILQLIEH